MAFLVGLIIATTVVLIALVATPGTSLHSLALER
jgi:hypothetical protein